MPGPTDRPPPIWILVLSLATTASCIALFRLANYDGFGESALWHWPLLIASFVIAEKIVVAMHFRSASSAVTFIEVPLFLGALYMPPAMVWVSMTLGVAISLLVVQRLPLLKAAFNVVNLSLQGAAGLWIFHLLVTGADPLGPRGWAAAAIAAAGSSALAVGALVVVIFMIDGEFKGLRQMLFMTGLTSVVNVSLALVAASLIDYRPLSLLLLVFPAAMFFGAYRAYVSEGEQRDRIQAMHELALEVRSIRDRAGILPVLQSAAVHMRAGEIELVLFSTAGEHDTAVRYHARGADERVEDLAHDELVEVREMLPSIEVSRAGAALIGAVRCEEGVLGVLIMSDRAGDSVHFSQDDLAMFATITEQLGLALEKNQLGRAVVALERRGRELAHEASHDPLTGLANRSLLATRLESALSQGRYPSLLYLDLDEFKGINDQYGHDAGDRVLVEIASRFTSVVGVRDCVVRLGGDEFAVLLHQVSDDVGVANALLRVASEPIELAEGSVVLHASVGIARAIQGDSAAALVRKADAAMYSAKAEGKGASALA